MTMTRKKISAMPFLLAVAVLAIALPAAAQEYHPSVGQEGKDVIWVPTPDELISAMLDMAKVTPNDFVIDLGSGDGRIVIAAAKRGARAMGVEFNPDMVDLSRKNAEKAGVSQKATFVRGDIFEADFSQATVLTMYLLPDLNMRLRPKILEMKPGTRVVTHAFTMEDWEADQTINVEERSAFLWIVPAKVAGKWSYKTPSGAGELTLTQSFQNIQGSITTGGKNVPLKNAKLTGDLIAFTVPDNPGAAHDFTGHVKGNSIEGTEKTSGAAGAGTRWTAQRQAVASR